MSAIDSLLQDCVFSRTKFDNSPQKHSAPELRDGHKDILLRMEGAPSRGSEAARETAAPRGNVGFSVCSTRITHVAAPNIYSVGTDNRPKEGGVSLSKRHGLRAPRYLAARFYKHRNGQIPPNWDWAAKD